MTITRYDLGTSYLGGISKPTSDDVGKFAVVRLDGLDRPNLSYETQVATVADDTFATTLAPFLRGSGLTVDSSGNLSLRARPRRAILVDHFFGGAASSGSIGSLGWNLSGSGTPAISRGNITTSLLSERYTIATSGSANDRSSLTLGSSETLKVAFASQCELLQFALRPVSVANVRVFAGLMGDFSQEPSAATTALGLYYDSGVGPNWKAIARSAGAGSPVDSGIAASTVNGILVSIWQPTAGTHQLYIGNTLAASISSGIPTAVANLGFRIETLTGSAKSLSVSHFTGILNLADANDDDTFLEA